MLCNKSNELVIWRTTVHRVFKTHLQNWDNASIVTNDQLSPNLSQAFKTR